MYRHMILCITINCHFFVCLGSLICRMVAEEGPKPMVITLRYKYEYTTLIQIQLKIQTEILPELTCQQVGSRGEEGGSTFIDRGEKPQHLPLSSLAGRPAVCRLLLSTHPPPLRTPSSSSSFPSVGVAVSSTTMAPDFTYVQLPK